MANPKFYCLANGHNMCCAVHGCDQKGRDITWCGQCEQSMHVLCFQTLVEKELRSTDPMGHPILICSEQCLDEFWKKTISHRRCLWYTDGKQGPRDPLSSEGILVQWLAAGNNYETYRGYRKNGKYQQNTCQGIAKAINARGVTETRTGEDVMQRITRIESQMEAAFRWETKQAGGVLPSDEYKLYCYREKLLRCCKYFDILAPIFRNKTIIRAVVEDRKDNDDNDDDDEESMNPDIDIPRKEAKTNISVRSPDTRCDTRVPAELSEGELAVSRNSRSRETSLSNNRKRTAEEASLNRHSGSKQVIGADVALSNEPERRNIVTRSSDPYEIERRKLAELKRKNDWEERKNTLREYNAQLDIDLKKVQITKQEIERDQQRLSYRMHLYNSYRDLLMRQHCCFAEIANLFPEMIELFPLEEKFKYTNN